MDPDEIFSWEVPELDAALKELGIQMGKSWTKSKKANELSKALERLNVTKPVEMPMTSQDPNMMMLQVIQAMQQQMTQQMEAQAKATAAQMEAIAEKLG